MFFKCQHFRLGSSGYLPQYKTRLVNVSYILSTNVRNTWAILYHFDLGGPLGRVTTKGFNERYLVIIYAVNLRVFTWL